MSNFSAHLTIVNPEWFPCTILQEPILPDIQGRTRRRRENIRRMLHVEPEPSQPSLPREDPSHVEGGLPDHDEEMDVLTDLIETHFQRTEDEPNVARGSPLSGRGTDGEEALRDEASTPLYPGARLSKLSTILLLTNLQQKYNVPNAFMDGLFGLMRTKILPNGNKMPEKRSEVKRMLSTIGLEYRSVHACPNDCYLYKDIPDDSVPGQMKKNPRTDCPVCGISRYRSDTVGTNVPAKVLRWFPIIPRLLHMYRCSSLAELMLWHSTHRSNDGIMRSVADSPAMQHVETAFDTMRGNPRTARLGLATDGFSPVDFSHKSYSIWPVFFINYNIPPWLSTKKGHILLSLIIPGPKKPKDMDVYLQPVIDELELL